jgi:hypothetical protein
MNETDPHPQDVVLFVEAPGDARVVERLLWSAGYTNEHLEVVPGSSKYGLAKLVRQLAPQTDGTRYAILIDLDEPSIVDARQRAREQLGDPPAQVFCAVPTIEAWLFADDRAVREYAKQDEDISRIVERLPLPEEIPDPKQLARMVFGAPKRWLEILDNIDIGRACARSPSLRSFIEGMGELLQQSGTPMLERVARHMSRDVIAGLVREVSPAKAVIWRTADGDTYTAAELGRHIEAGDELGQQYASDLLRVARDFLRRTANRKQQDP